MSSFIPFSSGFWFLIRGPFAEVRLWCRYAAKLSEGGFPWLSPHRGPPPVWGRGALYSPCSSRPLCQSNHLPPHLDPPDLSQCP